jgi:hypothetical protein
MSGIDVEVARAGLVIGLVFSAFVYHFFRVAAGGTVTGAYLALLLFTQQWVDVAAWLLLSLIGVGAIRLAAKTWPLPRAWLFAIGVIVPAGIHTVLIELGNLPLLEGFSAFLAAGLYITNGLTAYDAQRQGIPRTFLAAAAVAGLTLAALIPISWGMAQVRQGEIIESAVSLTNPVLVFAGILIALTVRVAFRLGTAGIIGGLFLLELYSIASTLVILAFTLIGYAIYQLVAKFLGLTPKQRLYSLLIVGSISSWFGLFWAEWLGIPGAEAAHSFGVEPLLVIGLLIAETARYGIPKMLTGASIVVVTTLLTMIVMEQVGGYDWIVLLTLIAVLAIPVAFALRRVRRGWLMALYGGEDYGPEGYHPPADTMRRRLNRWLAARP